MTWAIERPDGAIEYLEAAPTAADGPFIHAAELPRPPAADGTEDWAFDAAAFVVDVERRLAWIDRQHGEQRIRRAHAIKAVEARLILAGVPIDGLVAREAAETGQDLAQLAEMITANADADADAEIARIAAKRATRAGD